MAGSFASYPSVIWFRVCRTRGNVITTMRHSSMIGGRPWLVLGLDNLSDAKLAWLVLFSCLGWGGLLNNALGKS